MNQPDQWHEDPTMFLKQNTPIVATIDSDIYVIFNEINDISDEQTVDPIQDRVKVQKFDTIKNKWTLKAAPPGAILSVFLLVKIHAMFIHR